MPRLKILFAASECVPFAKTGGLADVVGALPSELAARGHDVRVVLPRYRTAAKVPAERHAVPLAVPVGHGEAWSAVWEAENPGCSARFYLLEQNELFDRAGIYGENNHSYPDNLARFTFLSRGALRLCKHLQFTPDVIHVHDWQTSLIPVYLNTILRNSSLGQAASVLTIHNLAYQGWFDKEELYQTTLDWRVFHAKGLEAFDRINLLKGGIYNATLISTVSPRYAMEIKTPIGGEQLDGVLRERGTDVIGILNGIDEAVWNPESDPHIDFHFSALDLSNKAKCKALLQGAAGLPERSDVPLIGIISRFAEQKGVDLIAQAMPRILNLDVQVIVLGSGDPALEEFFRRVANSTASVSTHIGFNDVLAHQIEAGADLFLMPSRYEPCGLNQLYSQRYGTLPIVRGVGGLDDTVEDYVTGFKFTELSANALFGAVAAAVHTYRVEPEHFRTMQKNAMQKPLGWAHASRQYEALYRLAVAKRRAGAATAAIA